MRKHKILVVDDDYDIGLTFKIGLEDGGYHVDLFIDPKKALLQFKPYFYDIGLIDIRMPTMNGFELSEHLMRKDETLKICFITAFEVYYKSLIESFPTIDAKCIIKKPISNEDLLRHMEYELKKKK